MPSSKITPAQQAFIDALSAKLHSKLGSRLDGTFSPLNYPAGLPYMTLVGPNNYYNENELGVIDRVPALQSNGTQGLTAQRFSNLYQSVLEATSYEICDADQRIVDEGQKATQGQQAAVITEFESAIGSITPAEIEGSKCYPPTKMGYIDSIVQSKWGGDPTKIPDSLPSFKSAYQSYYVKAAAFVKITNRASLGNKDLAAAVANVSAPTAANGGFAIASGQFDVAFEGLPTNNQILASLGTAENAAKISFMVDNFSSTESHLRVDGHAGFSIPVGDFLSLGFKGGASYSVDKYASSATQMEMETTYPGLSVISTTPLSLSRDNAKGWYSPEIVSELIAKTGDDATSGFKLTGSEFGKGDFGTGKKFARVKTFVISNEPTMKMTFKGGDVSKIASNFQEHTSVSAKLFGLFDVGGASQSYQVKHVDDHSVAGQVSVTLGPTKPAGTVDAAHQTAYVLGGVIDYPQGK